MLCNKVMKEYYLISELADILGVSKETLRRWDNNEKLKAQKASADNSTSPIYGVVPSLLSVHSDLSHRA